MQMKNWEPLHHENFKFIGGILFAMKLLKVGFKGMID